MNLAKQSYEVVVVCLGCYGLSAANYAAQKGLKVLGLERFSDTGSIGTSSNGYSRIWRIAHNQDMLHEMEM